MLPHGTGKWTWQQQQRSWQQRCCWCWYGLFKSQDGCCRKGRSSAAFACSVGMGDWAWRGVGLRSREAHGPRFVFAGKMFTSECVLQCTLSDSSLVWWTKLLLQPTENCHDNGDRSQLEQFSDDPTTEFYDDCVAMNLSCHASCFRWQAVLRKRSTPIQKLSRSTSSENKCQSGDNDRESQRSQIEHTITAPRSRKEHLRNVCTLQSVGR